MKCRVLLNLLMSPVINVTSLLQLDFDSHSIHGLLKLDLGGHHSKYNVWCLCRALKKTVVNPTVLGACWIYSRSVVKL